MNADHRDLEVGTTGIVGAETLTYKEALEWIAQMGPEIGGRDSRLHPTFAPMVARAALDGREIINPTKETGERRANGPAPDHKE